MGIVDKIVSTVTPEPSEEKKQEVRAKARAAANGSGWLSDVLDHHLRIEEAFAAVAGAMNSAERRRNQETLALLLTGHSNAEEAVIYPAMALSDQKAHSGELYTEQSAAKVQMAALDELDPMSQDYVDKLQHLRAAVAHHVYEEESDYFPKLRQNGDSALQAKLTRRYRQEFDRYAAAEMK